MTDTPAEKHWSLRIGVVAFTVCFCVIVTWSLVRSADIKKRSPQLAARVISVSPIMHLKQRFAPDPKYRLASIEVTMLNGKKWYYNQDKVDSDLIPGQGVRAWAIDDNPDKMYIDKEFTNGESATPTPWTPWYLAIIGAFFISGFGAVAFSGSVSLALWARPSAKQRRLTTKAAEREKQRAEREKQAFIAQQLELHQDFQ